MGHVLSDIIHLLLFSHSVMSNSLQPHGSQHIRLPYPSPSLGACSNSCPLSWSCHPIISSSVSPSPAAFNLSKHQGLFQGVSSSQQVAKVLDFQLQHQSFEQDWFTLVLTGLISFGLLRVFSNTTVQKHQYFSTQLYHSTHTFVHDYWKNHSFD